MVDDRAGEYDRLLAFLGLADDAAVRTYFDERVTADRAHIGRWRTDVPADRLAAFEARYETLAARLGESEAIVGDAVTA